MNKTRGLLFTAILCIAATAHAQNTFTDPRDGKEYKAVTIGSQTWMAENLNYAENGSKCYDNNSGNCDKYGRLYNWNTAMNACPSGWHLPSGAEWNVLIAAVGGKDVAGKKLKAKSGWNDNRMAQNEFGFSALPGGADGLNGFSLIDEAGFWRSASEDEDDSDKGYSLYIRSESTFWVTGNKSFSQSVRCLKDNTELAKAATNENTSVQINKIWAEHNVEQNNERGMILHINFSAKNMYGKEGYVGVWFNENGRQLSFSRKKLFNNSEPYYKDFKYDDFKLFIPYDFDVQGYGKHDLKMEIYIADSKANSALARDSLNLTYTNSAPQYQQQYQQPQQQQQQQRDGLVDALDAFNAVLGTIATMNNQHQHNQHQQNQYQSNQYQNYQQDNGNCQARYDRWTNQADRAASHVMKMDKGKSTYAASQKNLRDAQKEMRNLRNGSECRGKITKSWLEDAKPDAPVRSGSKYQGQ